MIHLLDSPKKLASFATKTRNLKTCKKKTDGKDAIMNHYFKCHKMSSNDIKCHDGSCFATLLNALQVIQPA